MDLFTRAALLSAVAQIRKEPTPFLVWQEFEQISLHSIVIVQWSRGSKEHFRDAIHFWVVFLHYQFRHSASVDANAFFHAYLQDAYTQCQEISAEEFHSSVREYLQGYSFFEGNQDFALQGAFQQAWCVYNEGVELALLVETESEFVAFYWELLD